MVSAKKAATAKKASIKKVVVAKKTMPTKKAAGKKAPVTKAAVPYRGFGSDIAKSK